jgi:ferritin-like metal-binding protein YciE
LEIKFSSNKLNIMITNQQQVTQNSKLRELFIEQLKDIYWAEKKLVDTLPKLSEAASCTELKDGFSAHLQETKSHVTRLERVFQVLGIEAETTKCEAMAGIIEEGEDIIGDTEDNTAERDAGLIMAGQKTEHYEIATYGALVEIAKTLGFDEESKLLGQTLAEEKKADQLLTKIATEKVNRKAAMEFVED